MTRRCWLSVGGKAANDVYFSTHAFMAEDSTPGIVKFFQDYKAAYGTPPENAFAALGYDTVGLIADAITRAGSVDSAKIRDALASTQGLQGHHRLDLLFEREPGTRQDGLDHRRQGREALSGGGNHAEMDRQTLTGMT